MNFKNIGLIIGLLSMTISYLFYGRQQGMYHLLLVGSFIVVVTCCLAILFSKRTKKSKAIWILTVMIFLAIQYVTKPLLIKSSFLIYLQTNNYELTQVNNLLLSKKGNVRVYNNDITDKDTILTQIEKDILIKLRKKLNVYMIIKTENYVYYGLLGFLNHRIGLTYWIKNKKPVMSNQLLEGRWYY